jgi:pilus assembly protein CpaF
MVLMAGLDLPLRAIREQVASALDLVVHLSRLRDGTRRVVQISEVVGMEGDLITMNDVFDFHPGKGTDDAGRLHGDLRPTGIRPKLSDRLHEHGIDLPQDIFVAQRASRSR